MVRSVARACWLVGMLVWAACGGPADGDGGGDGQDPGNASRPGIGRSTAAPVGTPYVLPGGVELLQPIPGYDGDCIPMEQQSQEEKGSGALVRLCVALRNTASTPVRVELPAGLIFVSDELTTQNGLLVQGVPLEVPAQQTLYIPLHLYCLNEERAPSSPWDTFTLGPVTQDPRLRELISLVEGKFLPVPGLTEVQAAVSNITDGSGLTPQDRESLRSLPALGANPAPRLER
ncbi:hypothetical protein [Hyalangium sp.]|uniref:hypothetical protein n=1 Tax=Hyalangium sp. TaxID=2028555 RepID=UPI002D2F3D38|nr:hypothetical protein [Hyalangium sp.]HYH96522.1 hypothetical protein [Hyalangium sp.]